MNPYVPGIQTEFCYSSREDDPNSEKVEIYESPPDRYVPNSSPAKLKKKKKTVVSRHLGRATELNTHFCDVVVVCQSLLLETRFIYILFHVIWRLISGQKKKSAKINFWGPETARWGGGLPRERVVAEKFVPSLESLSSLGFEERNLGCPENFARMSRTPAGLQKVCAKKVCVHFSFPIVLVIFPWQQE